MYVAFEIQRLLKGTWLLKTLKTMLRNWKSGSNVLLYATTINPMSCHIYSVNISSNIMSKSTDGMHMQHVQRAVRRILSIPPFA